MKSIGGNSGYVGYSMSCRAMEARGRGEYPKTDFKKTYHVSNMSFNVFLRTSIIENAGWHHVSKFGNAVDFYKWTEEHYALIYIGNKKTIDRKSREGKFDEIKELFESDPIALEAEYQKETEFGVWRLKHERDMEILSIQNEIDSANIQYKESIVSDLKKMSNVVQLTYGDMWFNASNGVSIKINARGTELFIKYPEDKRNRPLLNEARQELRQCMDEIKNNIPSPDFDDAHRKIEHIKKEYAKKIDEYIKQR